MLKVRLFHWKADDARQRIGAIEAAGYQVEFEPALGPGLFRNLRSDPPAAVVIDLTRLPSHGREVATALRATRATRHIPLVFAGGDPEKVERIKALLPDAVFTSWGRIRSALKQAIAHPPTAPAVPAAMMERYAATPLPKKLGIKENSVVALVNAPRDIEATLGALPGGVALEEGFPRRFDLALWFVHSVDDLRLGIGRVAKQIGSAPLWIAWPKKASGVETDLSQQLIRETGLDMGLVDYKICSIDATWSGLAFVRRKV